MSQTNTNTDSCSSITNRNQISGRDEQRQGDPGGRDHGDCSNGRRNNLIAKYSFEGK